MLRTMLLGACVSALCVGGAQAQTELNWWHSMGGPLGEKLEQVAQTFNDSQKDYRVVPVNKGSYAESMTAAIAAFRAGEQPHILQVFEVGTGTFMAAKGAVYPVHELLQQAGVPFDPAAYLPAVTGYYSDTEGKLLSFPFNSSTPILYYNKDAFQKAGLDPEKAPETWADVAKAATALVESGMKCGFTTVWPSWINIENLSAWHNIPLATKSNGMGGLDAEFQVANPVLEQHLSNLAEWSKSKAYVYGGRAGDAGPLFRTGECGIMVESSAGRAQILREAQFKVGFGMMPYYETVEGAPQNSIIGGASLWVLRGHEDAEYKGVAQFLAYLSKPEVQADWHQFTGYLPITNAAWDLSKQQGFYEKNPGSDVSLRQINLNPPTENSKGLRFGNFVQIRAMFEEEMEAAIAGQKSAKDALASAQSRGNDMLREFQAQNQAQ